MRIRGIGFKMGESLRIAIEAIEPVGIDPNPEYYLNCLL